MAHPVQKALRPADALSRDEALRLLESRAQAAQHDLAGRTDAGGDVLHYLAEKGAVATRRAVAANPGAPAKTNHHLANDDNEDVRAELARKIARLMPDLSRDESDHVRALTIETLERLARDQAVKVRAVLAEEIKTLDCIPRFIAGTLARDVESMVAAPILEYSPLLSDVDLLEVVAAAKAEEVLAAVARRRPLSEPVADAIVMSLDIPAVAALLANPDAQIRRETLEELAAQAEQVQAWQVPLVMRPDLSKRAILRIASFVGASLIEQLVARYGLDDDVGHHLNRELRARLAEERDEVPPALEHAIQAVEAARASAKLDEGFVDDAIHAGERDTVVLALAALCAAPEAAVRKLFQARSPKAVTALAWKAGLSMRTAFKIQTFILKLPAAELLPARAGVHFPLTEDEMRWHLSYFGLPA